MGGLKDISISKKITISFLLLIFLYLVIVIFGSFQLTSIRTNLNQAISETLKMQALEEISVDLLKIEQIVDKSFVVEYLDYKDQIALYIGNITNNLKVIRENTEDYSYGVIDDLDKDFLNLFDKFNVYFELKNKEEDAHLINKQVLLIYNEIESIQEQKKELVNNHLLNISNRVEMEQEMMTDIIHKFVFFGIIFLFGGIIFSRYLASNITKPLKVLIQTAIKIGEGKLKVKSGLVRGDELGKLSQTIDQMVVNLFKSQKEIKNKNIKITEETKKLQIMLNSIGDGVFVINEKGVITLFNDIACKLTGYTKKEAIGKYYRDIIKLISEKDKTESVGFIEEAISKNKITRLVNHTLLIRKNKSELSISNSAAPISYSSLGKMKNIGVIVVLRDMTEERRIEKIKDEFLSLASHQMRTPLTSIRWFLEILKNEDAGEMKKKQKNYVDSAYKSTVRLLTLVNSLLNIGHIESTKLNIEPERIDLIKFSDDLLKELDSLVKEKNHKVIIKKPKKDLFFETDAKMLREVLLNLLSNAIKFTPDKGKIIFRLRKVKNNIQFIIKDNGYGIPKKQQTQVFNKFFRGENIMRVDTMGTGLGLAIAKNLVENMNGKISFESNEGKGTTFYVDFPVEVKKSRSKRKKVK